jgi:nicotinamidase-related amidase
VNSTALVVIDVQNGMFTFPERQPHDGDAFLARVHDLVARARAAKAPVLFVQHDGGSGHPLAKPSDNWRIHPGTGFQSDDIVVEKQHCDAFQDTDFAQKLTDLGAKRLIVAGMMTEYCVDTTCRRAFSLGYDVVLAADAHSTMSREHLTAAQIINHHNRVLGSGFAAVLPSAAIVFENAEALS